MSSFKLKATADTNLHRILHQTRGKNYQTILQKSNTTILPTTKECAGVSPRSLVDVHKHITEVDEWITQVRQLQEESEVLDFTDHTSDSATNEQTSVNDKRLSMQKDSIHSPLDSPLHHISVRSRTQQIEAHAVYTNTVKDVSEAIEIEIIKAANIVKDELARIDVTLSSILSIFGKNDALLHETKHSIYNVWAHLESICTERTIIINKFEQQLHMIEADRVENVRKGLKTLVSTLMQCVHECEVQRIIETEVYELNIVVISNRRAYADLLAKLQVHDVDVLTNTRIQWEKGEKHWCKLCHEHAIQLFQQEIKSSHFVNPNARSEIVQKILLYHQDIYDKQRIGALHQLALLGANVSTAQTQSALTILRETLRNEEDMNAAFFQELQDLHEAKMQEARGRREKLRLDLHGFGALSEEGAIDYCRDQLQTIASDPKLEEFFRMAGSLRSDIEAIVKRLAPSDLIYHDNVESVKSILDGILSAIPLAKVMEANGKTAERKAIQLTLEKIRKASKAEIIALIPIVCAQSKILLNLEAMSAGFKMEIDDIYQQLESFVHQISNQTNLGTATASVVEFEDTEIDIQSNRMPQVGNTLDIQSNISQSKRQTSSLTATNIEQMPDSGKLLVANKSFSSITTRKIGTSLSHTPSYTIELTTLRKIQRRLGTLLYASELPQNIQDHLYFVLNQLNVQTTANRIIDQAVLKASSLLLEENDTQSSKFLNYLGAAMETQSARMHEQCDKMMIFFAEIAKYMEENADNVKYVDLSVLDLLDKLKDRNDEQNSMLENTYAEVCGQLRHAADVATLEKANDTAINLLENMEKEFRRHNKCVHLAATHHVVAVEQQRRQSLSQFCSAFGLYEPHLPELEVSMELNSKADICTFLSSEFIDSCIQKEAEFAQNYLLTTSDHIVESDKRVHKALPPTKSNESNDKSKFEIDKTTTVLVRYSIEELVKQILCYQTLNESMEADKESKIEVELAEASLDVPQSITDTNRFDEINENERKRLSDEEDLANQTMANEDCRHEDVFMHKSINEKFSLGVPLSVLFSLVQNLRHDLFVKFMNRSASTAALTQELCELRKNDANFLLEERLSRHWPRKGRLNVQCYQPRISELESHKQRDERFIHTTIKKFEAQQTLFADQIASDYVYVEQTYISQLSFQTQLPLQQNLASLQGLVFKSNRLLLAFNIECKQRLKVLDDLSTSDTQLIKSLITDYLRLIRAQLFPDLTSTNVVTGCDYHPHELQIKEERLAELEFQLQEKITNRSVDIEKLRRRQEEVANLATEFKLRHSNCMQSLSIKEGLGTKYGLPRRTAQEKYRFATNRADELCTQINVYLEGLRKLHELEELGQINDKVKIGSDCEKSTAVLQILMRLRTLMYYRGIYFSFIKNKHQLKLVPAQFNALDIVAPELHNSLNDGKPSLRSAIRDTDIIREDDIDQHITENTFKQYVDQVGNQCRTDTIALYKQEGKMDELPPSGIPSALEEYLAALTEKARTYVAQEENKFHQQVCTFADQLVVIPKLILKCLLQETTTHFTTLLASLREPMELEYKHLMAQKVRHMENLRPELCSRNNVQQLKNLCNQELKRSMETRSTLQMFRAEVFKLLVRVSFNFETELVSMVQCLITLLDSSIMTTNDLNPLTSGEQLVNKKRKSLKRLRKLARIQEVGDKREVPRTTSEIAELKQRGEEPRFPKRLWPPILEFGLFQHWAVVKTRILTDHAMMTGSTDDELEIVNCENWHTEECMQYQWISLLTSAHRTLIRARDEIYIQYREFFTKYAEKIMNLLHERLQDEIKWSERWQIGIDKMNPIQVNVQQPEPIRAEHDKASEIE